MSYQKRQRKKHTYKKAMIFLLLLILGLNLLGCLPGFCDWYREQIYCRIADRYGMLTDQLSFSLGEVLMAAGILMAAAALIVLIELLISSILHHMAAGIRKHRRTSAKKAGKSRETVQPAEDAETNRKTALLVENPAAACEKTGTEETNGKSAKGMKKHTDVKESSQIFAGRESWTSRKILQKKRRRRRRILYLKTCGMILLIVVLVYTTNWILPLRASEISFDVSEDRTYSIEELEDLRTFMVDHLNQAAEEVPRDESGHVIYCTGEEMDQQVAEAMQNLGEEFPLLNGFYPQNKIAVCSAVLNWMDIGGFTYPYTMELTTNRYVTGLYAPMLLAHEESHHKGYYLESEANYLAYRALSASDDIRLQYAAYENMYYYVNSAYVQSLRQVMTTDELKAYYQTQHQRSDLVKSDEAIAQAEVDSDYESSVSKTAEKSLAPAAEAAADQGWSLQAKALGSACYDGVVEMLLKYYDLQGGIF